MDNIKSETYRVSEGTKVLKEYSTNFSSEIYDHVNKLSYFTTLFDELLVNISSNNRVVSKIEAAISELEETIEMKLDKITSDNEKKCNTST